MPNVYLNMDNDDTGILCYGFFQKHMHFVPSWILLISPLHEPLNANIHSSVISVYYSDHNAIRITFLY